MLRRVVLGVLRCIGPSGGCCECHRGEGLRWDQTVCAEGEGKMGNVLCSWETLAKMRLKKKSQQGVFLYLVWENREWVCGLEGLVCGRRD